MQREIKIASKKTLDKVKEVVDNLVENSSSGCVTTLKLGESVARIEESVSTLPYKFLLGCSIVYKGELHIFGGCDMTSTFNQNHYKFDGSSWTQASTLPASPSESVGAVVYKGEIHLLGEFQYYDEYEEVNITSNKHYKFDGTEWTKVSEMPSFLTGNCVVVYNDEIHVLSSGYNYSTNYHYKWNGTEWTEVSTPPCNFDSTGVSVVYNNEIHVLIGHNDPYTQHYKFDGSEWTEVSTLPYIAVGGKVVVLNNKLHLLGGYNEETEDTSTILYHYEWDGNEWTKLSDLPICIYGGSAVVFNNELHIFGGMNIATSSISTSHYRIREAYRKLKLFLFKGCTIDNYQTLQPVQNCAYENGALTVTEDGIVELGVETTEDSVTLVIGGGS